MLLSPSTAVIPPLPTPTGSAGRFKGSIFREEGWSLGSGPVADRNPRVTTTARRSCQLGAARGGEQRVEVLGDVGTEWQGYEMDGLWTLAGRKRCMPQGWFARSLSTWG
ncbi:hypothetical protein KIL84_005644 [Mauremys mutica]|uniref:Uncharacterized protein n=1 Tax=Mauremys mutica TaxID=74926 RepID=A0A9D4B3X0_9SAUR|nr:hypothetical protein KIL84_005644 [Mauremys mutica]